MPDTTLTIHHCTAQERQFLNQIRRHWDRVAGRHADPFDAAGEFIAGSEIRLPGDELFIDELEFLIQHYAEVADNEKTNADSL